MNGIDRKSARAGLVALAGILALLSGSSLAADSVPLARLSIAERLTTAPDSVVVQLGSRAVTLGELRAAHRAREATFTRAGASGAILGGKLASQQPVVLRSGSLASTNAGRLAGSVQTSNAVVEPASTYASAPADMKAFCSNAQGSACLYLPPDQELSQWNASILDFDALIDQAQCGKEGGTWGALFGSIGGCQFFYPSSVVVHFSPAANYQISSTANCDKSIFTYQIDVHGAIAIQLVHQQYANFSTGSSPSCVVRVNVGS
jgi:hypothetical protein